MQRKSRSLPIQELWDKIPNNSIKLFNRDVRGALYRVKIANHGFNIVYTRKGAFRSGEMHPNTQYDFILKGKFEIWTLENKRIVKAVKDEHGLVVIPPRIPHLFKCLEESIMIEWWDGPFKAEYYLPFRKYVEKQLLR